jgi:hypothetical protein
VLTYLLQRPARLAPCNKQRRSQWMAQNTNEPALVCLDLADPPLPQPTSPVLAGRPDRGGCGHHAPRPPPRPKTGFPEWGGGAEGSDPNRSPPTWAPGDPNRSHSQAGQIEFGPTHTGPAAQEARHRPSGTDMKRVAAAPRPHPGIRCDFEIRTMHP